MKTMTVIHAGKVFRWRGGSFISVWDQARCDEHVPDDMIDLPDSVNRAHATRDDIERIAQRYTHV